MSDSAPVSEKLQIIIYSSNRLTRDQVRLALGKKIAADLPEIQVSEFATYDAAAKAIEENHYDVGVFDAESVPGGMGLVHQINDEIKTPPPVLLLVARAADVWLATWSNASAVSAYPIDPTRLPGEVAQVVRDAQAGKQTALTPELKAPGVSSRHFD